MIIFEILLLIPSQYHYLITTLLQSHYKLSSRIFATVEHIVVVDFHQNSPTQSRTWRKDTSALCLRQGIVEHNVHQAAKHLAIAQKKPTK